MFETSKTVALARELAKTLQQDDIYKEFELARQANDEDPELQGAISRFNEARDGMEKARAEQNADDEIVFEEKMDDEYRTIMNNGNMIRYQHALTHLESLMNYVNNIISAGVNGQDPDTVDESSCTGDCASCGGHCH